MLPLPSPSSQLIKSKAEYDAILRENLNTLVVIKFFAPWCRSCKALDVKYRRMAVQHDDVKFVEVRANRAETVVGQVYQYPPIPAAGRNHCVPLLIVSRLRGPRKDSAVARMGKYVYS